jgi:hypothetical protein
LAIKKTGWDMKKVKLSFEANSVLKSLSDAERRQLKNARHDRELRTFLICELRHTCQIKHRILAELFSVNRATIERTLRRQRLKFSDGVGLRDLRNQFKFFSERFLSELDRLSERIS